MNATNCSPGSRSTWAPNERPRGLLPPVGWGDVATKGDLDQQIAATRHDIDVLRQDVRRLEARVDAVEASLRQAMRELLRTFGTWLVASQAAVIAAVSLLFVLH